MRCAIEADSDVRVTGIPRGPGRDFGLPVLFIQDHQYF